MGADDIRKTLYRIAILLFALSGQAEQATTVAPVLRRIVLYILRNGEFAALGLLFELMTNGQAMPSFEDYWDAVASDEPEDAMLLAARLRLFAFAVAVMAMRAGRAARNDRCELVGSNRRDNEVLLRALCHAKPAARQPAYTDTS